jgi:hypothetical protein
MFAVVGCVTLLAAGIYRTGPDPVGSVAVLAGFVLFVLAGGLLEDTGF